MGLIISEIIADNLFSVYDREWDAQGAQDNGTEESAQEEMIELRDLAGAVLVIRGGGGAMDHFQ